jgi:hypothetical protein
MSERPAILRAIRWQVYDARGTLRHVVRTPVLFSPTRSMFTREERRALRRYASRRLMLLLAPFSLAALAMLPWLHEEDAGKVSRFIAIALGSQAFLYTALAIRGVWLDPGRFRDGVLELHRCAACANTLEGVAADPADGSTVCPECGAAWRLE